MANTMNIKLPNGYTMSFESTDAAGVPDITKDSGENVMEAQVEQQKPVTDDAAEYDAAHEADTPKETENVQEVASTESSFYGLMVAQRALEGFGLKADKKGYESIDGFFKTPEAKAAMETAKSWLDKQNGKLTLAKTTDIKESPASLKAKIMGINKEAMSKGKSIGKFHQALGGVFYCWEIPGKPNFTAALMLKKANGDITFKYFVISAKLKNKGNAAMGLESVDALNAFLGLESEDAVPPEEKTEVTADTSTPETSDTTTTTTTTTTVEEGTDDASINVAEEVEGGTSGDDTSAPEKSTSSNEPEATDEDKAIESFFKHWGI